MILDDILAYLDALPGKPAGAVGTDLFGGAIPDGVVNSAEIPDVCTGILEYGGENDEVQFGVADVWRERPRLQFTTRGNARDMASARSRVEIVRRKIAQIPVPVALGGIQYYTVRIIQPPFWLRTDAQWRSYFVFNVGFYKDPQPE